MYYELKAITDAIVSSNLGQHDRSRAAAYAGFDARALKRFSLSAGVREEVYGHRQSQISPTVSGRVLGIWTRLLKFPRQRQPRVQASELHGPLLSHDPANIGSRISGRSGLGVTKAAPTSTSAAMSVRPSPSSSAASAMVSTTYATRRTISHARISALKLTGVEAALDTTIARRHGLEFQYTGLNGTQDRWRDPSSKYAFNYPIHSGVVSWTSALPAGIVARARFGALERYARDPYALLDLYAAGTTRGKVHPFLQLSNTTGTTYQEIIGVHARQGRSRRAGMDRADAKVGGSGLRWELIYRNRFSQPLFA